MISIMEITVVANELTARWWLDDRDDAGRVVLLVDGRAYVYHWPRRNRANGVDLLPWLLDRTGCEYAARKMGAYEFDKEETRREARRLACVWRREAVMDGDSARELFDAADNLTSDGAVDLWLADAERAGAGHAWESSPGCERVMPAFAFAWDALTAGRVP